MCALARLHWGTDSISAKRGRGERAEAVGLEVPLFGHQSPLGVPSKEGVLGRHMTMRK